MSRATPKLTPAAEPSRRDTIANQARFLARNRLTYYELSNWILTGSTDGFGYTVQGIDYVQQYLSGRR